jgi:hypothetical protein
MSKRILVTLTLLFSFEVYAQFEVSGGMGISFLNSPSFRDYLNVSYIPSGEQLSSFNSAVEFFGEVDYSISQDFQLGIEYAYQIYSFSINSSKAGFYEVSYQHHKPTLVAYYVIPGEGYKFKFGGGIGFRYLTLDEQVSNSPQPVNYTTSGLGFLLKIQGHTKLSGNLYANIGADMRYDMPGEPESSGKKIFDNSINENVNLNSLSFGVKLGVSYFF